MLCFTHPRSLLQWGGELHAHLSHAIFRFTDDQARACYCVLCA